MREVDAEPLWAAALHADVPGAGARSPSAVETLLRAAVDRLDGGRLAEVAAFTFGLLPGTRDWPGQDRRRRGAQLYGVGAERFRKHHEPLIIRHTADQILALCREKRAEPPEPSEPSGAGARSGTGAPAGLPDTAGTPDAVMGATVVTATLGGRPAEVAVHHASVDLLCAIDVVVSPTNTYFEVPLTFKNSISACLRRAAAVRNPAGGILDDVVGAELGAWMLANGQPGLAVPGGTIAPTSSGELGRRGIRRIYHAAVATPRAGSNDYDTDPGAVARAVGAVFELARRERARFDPPLRSICLPLLGAGRGGLLPASSLAWILGALDLELAADGSWQIHFVAKDAEVIQVILAGLARRPVPPG